MAGVEQLSDDEVQARLREGRSGTPRPEGAG